MTDPNTDTINISDFDKDWVEEFLTENSEDDDDDTAINIIMMTNWAFFMANFVIYFLFLFRVS